MVYPRMLNLNILDEDLTNLRTKQQNKKELFILCLCKGQSIIFCPLAALKAVWPLLLGDRCRGCSPLPSPLPFRLSTSTWEHDDCAIVPPSFRDMGLESVSVCVCWEDGVSLLYLVL